MADRTRFEDVVLPHFDAGYNLARWLARDVHDTEDVLQDACVHSSIRAAWLAPTGEDGF